MVSLLLMRYIAQLFLMMFMGAAVVRAGALKTQDSRVLSVTALYLITPCLIISSFLIDMTPAVADGLKIAFLAALVLHITYLLLGEVLRRVLHFDPVEVTSAIYSNGGNLIIPIVTYVFGEEWVIYTSAFICVQQLLFWTHCSTMLCGAKKVSWKKVLCNVNILSVAVGLLLFLTGLRPPQLLQEVLHSVSATVGPVCMFASGMILAGISFRQVVAAKRVWLVCLLRLVLFPAAAIAVLHGIHLLSLPGDQEQILIISFLAASAPSAATIVQQAQLFRQNAEYACIINVVSTLLCILTMPLLLFLYQL